MEENQSIAHDVLRAIRRIVRRVAEYSKQLSADVGLTVPQLLIMKAIGELEQSEGGTTVIMVSQRVQLAPPTVSRIIDRLVKADLVQRQRSEIDRRKVHLTLTVTGTERFQTLPAPLQDIFVQRLEQLDEQDRRQLLAALERITHLMEASDIDAAPLLSSELIEKG